MNDTKDIDTSNLGAESDFIALNTEVKKRDINKLVNISTSLNNLKTKVLFSKTFFSFIKFCLYKKYNWIYDRLLREHISLKWLLFYC